MLEYRVAVRELAEFCHRRGDIDYRFTPSPTGEQGIAGHQQLYRERPDSYRPEYPLALDLPCADFTLQLRGRADGYDAAAGRLEEIKTCRAERHAIPQAAGWLHWAQARLYGALLCAQEPDREALELQLTYLNVDSGESWSELETCGREQLQQFLADCLDVYVPWMTRWHQWRGSRDASIAALAFPYPGFRAGQREMAESVYKCIDQRGQLLLQAPTGVGKTAAVLFPALKAMAAGKHDFISFVTARTSGRRAAEQTLQIMQEKGLQLRRLSLTARDSICFSPGKACHGDDCAFARGYYDRLPEALAAAMEETDLSRAGIEALARRFEVCPYQLAIDLVPWVDLCIGDIHYVYSFNPTLSSLLSARRLRWSVMLDEAHNLPDRARSMYTATLSKAALMAARRVSSGAIRKALDRLNRVLLALQKEDWLEPDFHSSQSIPQELVRALSALVSTIAEAQSLDPLVLQRQAPLLDFYFGVLQFQRVLEVFGDDYRFELQRGEGEQSLLLRLNCLDASRLLSEHQLAPHSVSAFSATVSPPDWVLSELGFGELAVFRDLPSPFEPSQYQVCINTSLDTRFRARRQGLAGLREAIADWLSHTPGNCIIYFPAYQYMRDALDGLESSLQDRQLWVQQPRQRESARAGLLELLQSESDVAAFCILGGVYGEGIDLPGDDLSSVVIVGVGLPQFSRERQVLRDYYQHKSGRGYECAYLYPGMQRVSQALGRVIRRESDRGSALLIDSRYAQEDYRALLPDWWEYRLLD